jgi:transcriptional regulator NrdR family protein
MATAETAGPMSSLSWVRKREGDIQPFDTERLQRSIASAAREAGAPLSDEALAELGRMVSFLIGRHVSESVPTTSEISHWVYQCLVQTGHARVASAYREYGCRREEFRRAVCALREEPVAKSSPAAGGWSKSRWKRLLVEQLLLDDRLAAEIVRRVERFLIDGRLTWVTEALVCALVNGELADRGYAHRLTPPGVVSVHVAELDELLNAGLSPAQVERAVAERVWRQYSAVEIFAPEVLALEREARLFLRGPFAPVQLAGLAVDLTELWRQTSKGYDLVQQVVAFAARVQAHVMELMAFDLVDVALALASEGPGRLPAEILWQELSWSTSTSGISLVLNLYARLPARALGAAGAGPLFPAASSRSLADATERLAEELLQQLAFEDGLARTITVDWHWFPQDPAQLDSASRRALSLALKGYPVRFVLDRYVASVGDGLVARSGAAALLRVDLPLLGLLHAPDNLPPGGLSREARRACSVAVAAGAQKRETLRRYVRPDHPLARYVDQAAVVVCPLGLDELARAATGYGIAEHPSAAGFAAGLVRLLQDELRRAARNFGLPVRLDRTGPGWTELRALSSGQLTSTTLRGLTCWSPGRGLREQIHRVGQLHREAAGGTLVVPLPHPAPWSAEELAETLNWAYEASSIVRLQFVPLPSAPAERTLWEAGLEPSAGSTLS